VDPITHAIVGLGIAALSGQPLSLTNPIYIGAALGALAPDIDVAAHYNPLSFLEHHRGASHSLPGILALSGLIAACLAARFPEAALGLCWGWAFLGALSHTLLDSLNSYGTRLWWPWRGRKWTGNLLVLFDPYLPLLWALPFFGFAVPGNPWALPPLLSTLYLGGRYRMKQQLAGYLKKTLGLTDRDRVVLMPARFGFARWEFIIEGQREFILGKINYYGRTVSEKVRLAKEENPFTERALSSRLGRFFRSFTPHLHAEYRRVQGRNLVLLRDLRYMKSRRRFLHTATVVLSDELQVLASCLHAYREDWAYPVEGEPRFLKPLSLEGD
jgi:inner membrane protein